MTNEITYGGFTYGIFSTKEGFEFDYEMKEDENGNKYKSDECSDYANFQSAIAEHIESERDYFNYGESF